MVGEFLVSMCQSKPSCQWAPPLTSMACSSTALYRATDGKGMVTGEEKKAVYGKMCDEKQTNWWNLRRNHFPLNFDCSNTEDLNSHFTRTFYFAGGANDGEDEDE